MRDAHLNHRNRARRGAAAALREVIFHTLNARRLK